MVGIVLGGTGEEAAGITTEPSLAFDSTMGTAAVASLAVNASWVITSLVVNASLAAASLVVVASSEASTAIDSWLTVASLVAAASLAVGTSEATASYVVAVEQPSFAPRVPMASLG